MSEQSSVCSDKMTGFHHKYWNSAPCTYLGLDIILYDILGALSMPSSGGGGMEGGEEAPAE